MSTKRLRDHGGIQDRAMMLLAVNIFPYIGERDLRSMRWNDLFADHLCVHFPTVRVLS